MPTYSELAELLTAIISWPMAIFVTAALFVFNIRRIGSAFRRLPVIRKLTIYGVEFELDEGEIRELKKVTNETFKRLIQDSDDEIEKFSKICGLSGAIEAAANNVLTNRPSTKADCPRANFRATLHIPDPVFVDQLYQVSDYCYEAHGRRLWFGDGSAGRRFSIRYGIIGLAFRSRESHASAQAFQGENQEAKDDLIKQWSMLPQQASKAAEKPSCLAITLREPETEEILGIFYADAEIGDFFGSDAECSEFARECEEFQAMTRLRDRLVEFRKFAVQISVNFDLVRIGQKS